MDTYLTGNCDRSGRSINDQNFCGADPGSPLSLLLGCPIKSCPARVAEANPISFVDRNDPPLLLLHGQQDDLVPWQQSQLLFNAVYRASGRAELVLIPHGQHGQALSFLTDPTASAGSRV